MRQKLQESTLLFSTLVLLTACNGQSVVVQDSAQTDSNSVESIAKSNPYLNYRVSAITGVSSDSYDKYFVLEDQGALTIYDMGAWSNRDEARKENVQWIPSPDGLKAITINATTTEPDQSIDVFNRLNNQHVERFGFCGTPCGDISMYWLDNDSFASLFVLIDYSSESAERNQQKLVLTQYNLSDETFVQYISDESLNLGYLD